VNPVQSLKSFFSISEQTRRMSISWTRWRLRRRTRRLARRLEAVKQRLATMQVMAAAEVEKGKLLEQQLLPLLAPEPPPMEPRSFQFQVTQEKPERGPLIQPHQEPEPGRAERAIAQELGL
jgi:hypothetical protein